MKKCPTILFPITGNMTCVDALEPFSFGTQCNFTCQEGYYLTGDNTLGCLASGQWSRPTPTCTGAFQNRNSYLKKNDRNTLLSLVTLPIYSCAVYQFAASAPCLHAMS